MSEQSVPAFSSEFFGYFAAESVLLVGLVLLIVVPNLGKGTFRVPGTQARVPWFFGGERYAFTGRPDVPGYISVFVLLTAFMLLLNDLLNGWDGAATSALVHAHGDTSVRILAATPFSRLMETLFIGALLLVAVASLDRYRSTQPGAVRSVRELYNNRRQADLHILLLTCALGMSTVALAENLFVLFVGLELASFSSYVLVAFNKESKAGSEGGMKYFIVGSASSGVGLYGLSLLYLWAGTLQVDALALAWSNIGQEVLPYVALGLMLVGFGFKVSAAPFHFAAPDAYAGAASPFAGLLATASKAMGMVGLFRILLVVTLPDGTEGSAVWLMLLGILAAVTMTWGNIAALGSTNPKRMLAYSSVAHAGYMLAALTAVGVWNLGEEALSPAAQEASEAVLTALLFHLVVLVAFKMGAFLVLGVLENEGEIRDDRALAGLGRRSPLLAVTMFIFMLSLAGVPPLSGFLSKLLVIMGIVKVAAVDVGTSGASIGFLGMDLHWVWGLALLMVLNSAISVFYYLRIGVVMFFDAPAAGRDHPVPRAVFATVAITACLVGTLLFGIWGDPLIEVCRSAAAALLG